MSASDPRPREPVWPGLMIVFGVSLSAAWVILLGYGVISLIDYLI